MEPMVVLKTFLLVLTIMFSQYDILKCVANTPSSSKNIVCAEFPKKPKITILSDSEDFMAGDGRIIYNKPLHLECSAAYPIYWDFIPPTAFTYDIASKVRNNCYTETLSIWINASQPSAMKYDRTGNYSCISGLDKNIRSWNFLHIRDADYLFRRKIDSHEYAESVDEEYWSIPCISTVKKLDLVELFSSKNGTNTSTVVANYTKFDPQFGFLLQKSHFPRPDGSFECQGVLGNVSDIYNVSLKGYNVYPKWNFAIYTNNTMEFLCEADEDIRLDLSKAHKLKTISSVKTINSKTQSFKYSLKTVLQEHENVSMVLPNRRAHFSNAAGEISCVTVNSSRILHSWDHDFTKIFKCQFTGPREETIWGESYFSRFLDVGLQGSCENIFGSPNVYCEYMPIASVAKNAIVHQNFHILNSKDTKTSPTAYSKNYTTTGIRCLTYTHIYTFTTSVNLVATESGYKVNPVELDKQKNLKVYVRKEERIDYVIGDIIQIWCAASRYIFSDSIYWTINYKNGTSSPFVQGSIPEFKFPISYDYTTPLQWAYLENVNVELTEQMQSISCSAVVWNSTEIITGNYSFELKNPSEIGLYKTIKRDEADRCNWSSSNPLIMMRRITTWHGVTTNIVFSSYMRLALYNVTDADVKETISYASFPSIFCNAPYPIEWTFEDNIIEMTRTALPWTAKSMENNSASNLSPCFTTAVASNIAFYKTGKYTCRKKNDFSTFSTVYVFAKSLLQQAQFINYGQHINVFVDVEEPLTIFPCRVNDPDVSVHLYHHDRPGVYRKLSDSDFELYDPKKGFYMETSKLKKSETYMCSINNSTAPQVSVFISIFIAQTNISKKGLSANSFTQFKIRDFLLSSKLDRTHSEILTFQVVMLVTLVLILAALMWFAKRMQRSVLNEIPSRATGLQD